MGTLESINLQPIPRKDVESWFGCLLTDKEWEKIGSEIEERVENFIDGLLQQLIQDYLDGIFV